METKGRKLEKIKSKYILNTIFEYVPNVNYKLKLFVHSKSIQNKYELKIEYKYYVLKQYLKIKEFINLE